MPAIFTEAFSFSFFIDRLNYESNYTDNRYYTNYCHQYHMRTF